MPNPTTPKSRANSSTWIRAGLIAVAIAAAFWLGTRYTTKSVERPPTVNPRTTGANDASQVQLQLDAGSLTLAPDPDAGLRLKPLPTLDPDALYRESLDAGPPAPRGHTPP